MYVQWLRIRFHILLSDVCSMASYKISYDRSLHLMGSQNQCLGSLWAVNIYLDLTKRRYGIRKHAIEKVKNNPKIDLQT